MGKTLNINRRRRLNLNASAKYQLQTQPSRQRKAAAAYREFVHLFTTKPRSAEPCPAYIVARTKRKTPGPRRVLKHRPHKAGEAGPRRECSGIAQPSPRERQPPVQNPASGPRLPFRAVGAEVSGNIAVATTDRIVWPVITYGHIPSGETGTILLVATQPSDSTPGRLVQPP